MAYATRADVFKYSLARGALAGVSRLAESALASNDTFELADHGYATNDTVTLRAAEGGTLPAPLVAGTTYYVILVTDGTFKLAASAGGAAINLTTDGVDVYVSNDLPFDDVLEAYSRFVDGYLPAHLVPFTAPYPRLLTMIVAELAAKKLLAITGVDSAIVEKAEASAILQLQRWAAGLPVRDTSATSPANLAITSTVDSRGWGGTDSGSLP
jgi:hypothetical protein